MNIIMVILEHTPSLPCPHTFFTSSSRYNFFIMSGVHLGGRGIAPLLTKSASPQSLTFDEVYTSNCAQLLLVVMFSMVLSCFQLSSSLCLNACSIFGLRIPGDRRCATNYLVKTMTSLYQIVTQTVYVYTQMVIVKDCPPFFYCDISPPYKKFLDEGLNVLVCLLF